MIQQTSLKAFQEIQPKLPECRRIVYETIKKADKDLTNMEIAARLGWSINRVTPRVKELREMGLVILSQVRKCRVTKNTAKAWKIKETS